MAYRPEQEMPVEHRDCRSDAPEVSVVIVNFHSDEYTIEAIRSLQEQETVVDYEIIVVNNGSEPSFADRLAACAGKVRCVGSGSNLGFGAACNLAIAQSEADYILLLNPDTRALNDILTTFRDYCLSHEKIGCIGPYLLDEDEEETHSYGVLDSYRRDVLYEFFYALKKLLCLKKARLASAQPVPREREKDVEYITGACLFLPRDVFNRLGGFDEQFFVYSEETDLQWRMRDAGLKRVIVDGPRIVHLVGKTFKTSNGRRIMMNVSKMRFVKKHYSRPAYWFFKLVFIKAALIGLVADVYYRQYSFAENRHHLGCLISDRYG